MKLSQEEVEHIAKLANLNLNKQESDKIGQQMADTLDYIKQLNEIDTQDIKPTAQITGLENSWREDLAKKLPESDVKKLLQQSPDSENGYIKVKRVLDF